MYTRLESAGSPRNDLLDYIPPNDLAWVFVPAGWNNTCSFERQSTPQKLVKLHDSGNRTKLRYDARTERDVRLCAMGSRLAQLERPFQQPKPLERQFFLHVWRGWEYEQLSNTNRAMDISLVAVRMHYLVRSQNDTDGCNYMTGDIRRATTQLSIVRSVIEHMWTTLSTLLSRMSLHTTTCHQRTLTTMKHGSRNIQPAITPNRTSRNSSSCVSIKSTLFSSISDIDRPKSWPE